MMFTLANATGEPEGLGLMLVGFFVVCFILLSLAGVTALIGFAFKIKDKLMMKSDTPVVITPQESKVQAFVAPEIMAVISAAVFVAMQGNEYKIVSIEAAAKDLSWAKASRNDLFKSHKLR
ncbi:MAG: OadG family protein [Opitutales bacterium]